MSNQWGVGNKADSKAFETGHMDDGSSFELIHGEYPHSRRDDNTYARFPDGTIEGFDGHRILVRIDFRTFNYLKCSGLSGNEVRKGGQFRIYLNEMLAWAEFCRDPLYGLQKAQRRLEQLLDLSVQPWIGARTEQFVGRKIYWKDQPAIIESWIQDNDSGSGTYLMLRADGEKFRRPAYLEKDEEHEDSETVKVDILDRNIWWFRD